ncbi:MAG: DUF6596 domain-containing protein [Planctomycetota bacterium]
MKDADVAIDSAVRTSYGKLVALLARATSDLDLAEEAVADAFSDAVSAWRESGVPDAPEAWLLTAARRRWIDRRRRAKRQHDLSDPGDLIQPMPVGDAFPDERLSLLFACAHPAIDPAVRTPLLLRCILGVPVEQIASAMLVSPAAMKQRLTRGKAKIRDAGIQLAVPGRDELADRLNVTLEAVYAAFNAAIDCADLAPAGLKHDALEIARLIAELLPNEPEAIGLLALCLYVSARFDARLDFEGRYVPLDQQDTSRWDAAALVEAEELLRRAATVRRPGRFQIEASIQSTHVERIHSGSGDWSATLRFYDLLVSLAPSLGAAVSRAAALLRAAGPEICLAELDRLPPNWGDRLNSFQPYWAVRAETLMSLGKEREANSALTRAIGLCSSANVREYLAAKLQSDPQSIRC